MSTTIKQAITENYSSHPYFDKQYKQSIFSKLKDKIIIKFRLGSGNNTAEKRYFQIHSVCHTITKMQTDKDLLNFIIGGNIQDNEWDGVLTKACQIKRDSKLHQAYDASVLNAVEYFAKKGNIQAIDQICAMVVKQATPIDKERGYQRMQKLSKKIANKFKNYPNKSISQLARNWYRVARFAGGGKNKFDDNFNCNNKYLHKFSVSMDVLIGNNLQQKNSWRQSILDNISQSYENYQKTKQQMEETILKMFESF